ncbi:MAG TPA: FixH family protein [Pyrinomonadaceae bacterium]|nr:FixH family protein [Pyrinomonadaceae bacterium]
MDTQITPQPVRVGAAMVRLELRDLSGQPLSGAHILVEGNMTHPGMKPEFGEAKEVEPGRYQAPLEFTMAGDWLLIYHVTLQSGEKLEPQVEVKGVRAN